MGNTLRNKAIVAFIRVVAVAIAVNDHVEPGKVSTEEFLKTVDLGLEKRLKQSDGADLAAPLRTLRKLLGKMAHDAKIMLELGRRVDEVFDDNNSKSDS